MTPESSSTDQAWKPCAFTTSMPGAGRKVVTNSRISDSGSSLARRHTRLSVLANGAPQLVDHLFDGDPRNRCRLAQRGDFRHALSENRVAELLEGRRHVDEHVLELGVVRQQGVDFGGRQDRKVLGHWFLGGRVYRAPMFSG
jgi:hypothetical protein